jgi:hypothetical protein
MRLRTVFHIVALAVVAALAVFNWAGVIRPETVNLPWLQVEVPLNLILLALLGVEAGIGLLNQTAGNARDLLREGEFGKRIQMQIELADRAEAAHYNELRQTLDTLMRESRQRGADLSTGLEQSLLRHHREIRVQLEGLHRGMGSRLGEMEARLEARLDAMSPNPQTWTPSGPSAAATQGTGEVPAWAEPATVPKTVPSPSQSPRPAPLPSP